MSSATTSTTNPKPPLTTPAIQTRTAPPPDLRHKETFPRFIPHTQLEFANNIELIRDYDEDGEDQQDEESVNVPLVFVVTGRFLGVVLDLMGKERGDTCTSCIMI